MLPMLRLWPDEAKARRWTSCCYTTDKISERFGVTSNRVTECPKPSLDHLNKDERDNHLRRNLFADGPYYCQIVIQHTRGEERLNFTVLVPTTY